MNAEMEKNYFLELLIKAHEGRISPDEVELLNGLIKSNDEAAYLYVEFFDTVSGLIDMNEKVFSLEDDDLAKYEVWLNYLADEEKIAPSVKIPAVPKEPEADQAPTRFRKGRHPVSKFSIFSLLLSSAALIFVIVYARFVTMKSGIEVATLTDNLNAKWADMGAPMAEGTRMATGNEQFLLREGYAELLFDNQTQVTFEGPAEFQILAEDRIGLNYGKAYVTVPKEAIGFSIYTQSAKIIDLGTEYGVQAEVGGNTHLYVLKGKTILMAGRASRVNMEVSQGNAKKISGETGEISDIRCPSDYFVRDINSKSKSIWRGQNLDLADIVGGGNGLGTGKRGSCIDTTTGEWKPESYLPSSSEEFKPGTRMTSNYRFNAVKDNPFIDGVFIPDNSQGPVVINSQGHSFGEFPDTSGLGWGGIVYIEERLVKRSIELNKVRYGVPGKSALFMHGNAGVTFDLEKIRDAFPGSLREFRAVYGIADDYWDGVVGCPAYADFWVLVDGQVRFSRKGVQVHQGGPISVVLSDQDRFLTLVTTDGGQGSPEYDNRTSFNDWSVFGEPYLVFE